MITKRLTFKNAPEKKRWKFITSPRGPHKLEESVALLTLIRDFLKLARNSKEAKKIIKSGAVSVDKRQIKDHKFGVGFMDVITIGNKNWRVMLKRNKIQLIEIPEKESELKICKVIGKRKVRGGKIQITLHDGRNIITDDNEISPRDSVLIHLPDQKIIEKIKFEKGSLGLVFRGRKDLGKIVKILSIEKFPAYRAFIESNGKKEEKALKSIIVVGKDRPLLTLGESA